MTIGAKASKNAWKIKKSEQEKIDEAIDHFAAAMKDRMNTKRRAGWKGWNEYPLRPDIANRLQKNGDSASILWAIREQLTDPEFERYKLTLADVANLAMILWTEAEHAGENP